MRIIPLIAAIIIGTVGLAGAVAAEPSNSDVSDDPKAPSFTQYLDRIWGYATLYENADQPILKKLAFSGRLQADFPLYDANQGDYDDAQLRRFRVGFKSRWFSDVTLHAEVDLDVGCDEGEDCDSSRYQGLTDAYIGWSPSDIFAVKLGKISAPFTLDGSTSSNRILTPERNNLTNNLWFPNEYHTGGDVSGRIDQWLYRVGVYSSSTDKEFGNLDGGYFTLTSLSYDLANLMDVPEFLIAVDYVYNESDVQNVGTRDLAHSMSVHLRVDTGVWGFRSDLSGGVGYHGQSDLIGIALMPFYSLTKTIQVVGRYTFIHSFEDGGIRFARYEDRIGTDRGEEYDEIFAGFNWYIYGHKLKLQTGFKYTWMEADRNYRGWGWTTGFRMYW